MKKNNKETVIKILNDKYNRKTPNSTNSVFVSMTDFKQTGIDEKEIMRILFDIESDGLIQIRKKSVQMNLQTVWVISVNSSCLHYFDIKKNEKGQKIRSSILKAIEIIVAIASLIGVLIGLGS